MEEFNIENDEIEEEYIKIYDLLTGEEEIKILSPGDILWIEDHSEEELDYWLKDFQ